MKRRKDEEEEMEPLENLRFFCNKHAPKKIAFDGDPVTLIGRHVKLGFQARPNEQNVKIEHMWVTVDSANRRNGVLTGKLANDPFYVDGIKCGSNVTFTVSDIEELVPEEWKDERPKKSVGH